jgi:hypothetical protein
LGNLLGLLLWSVAKHQWHHVASLGRAIDPYLSLHGLWDAWRKTLGEIQRASGALQDLALQGWVLHQLGTYEIGMGNLSAAQKFLNQAVSIRQKLGDEIGVAYSQHNLQVLSPAVKPGNQTGYSRVWLAGGIIAIALVAFLFFSNSQRNQAKPELTGTAPVIAQTETKLPVTSSASPTTTNTDTPTPIPSPTITATPMPSPTGTATAMPTYNVLSKVVVNDVAACFYGPGNVYQNKGTRRIAGNTVDLLGRIETDKGMWVNTKFSLPRTDASDPCWMNAEYLDITREQLMSVKPIDPANPDEYKLPIDYFSGNRRLDDPHITGVTRAGDVVTVSWEYFDVGKGDYPNDSETFYRYLIEAWLCRSGKIVFSPSGWGPFGPNVVNGTSISANIQDEPECTEASHGRLYLAWKHGYVGPVEIRPWPHNGVILPTTTP